MSKRKKNRQPKLQGTKATYAIVDEADSLTPGIWADAESKHTKPEEEPRKYATGGPVTDPGKAFAGIAQQMDRMGDVLKGFQQIGRATRNVGPISVEIDSLSSLEESLTLPPKSLSVEEHRDFIRRMMEARSRVSARSLYYTKSGIGVIAENPKEPEQFVPIPEGRIYADD